MFFSHRRGARRREIRKNRPDSSSRRWAELRASGTLGSLWVAVGFCLLTISLLMLREKVVPYRPGDFTSADLLSRVSFRFADKDELAKKQQDARDRTPHIYSANGDIYKHLRDRLLNLPQRVAKLKEDELEPMLRELLDSASLAILQTYASPPRDQTYVAAVASYLERVQQLDPIVLNEEQRHEELTMDLYRTILIDGRGTMRVDTTYSNAQLTQLRDTLLPAARAFPDTLAPKIIDLTIRTLKESPTHLLNETRTLAAQNQASDLISPADAQVSFNPKDVLVHQGKINDKDWEILRAENEAFLHRGLGIWKSRAGTASVAALLTLILAAYIARFQPRIVRNQARGMAIAGLMFLMLIVAQLAGLSSSPTYLFGVAPTILVAMILTIAYEQRFAIGVSTIHAALVTMALNESHAFFLVLWIGVLSCCLLLDDIRTRDKLILVGFATALALIIASCAASLLQLVPPSFMLRNALFAGASGLGVGFVVLGILPFIEKWFKITTSMTLMELADSSQPLLRRLALEAPGTYHHSMQVATLSAESAEAIGADSLLCRVGAYYHDIGKINKPDYFVENQSDGKNRHLSLSPNVSYLIIIGHVKDGVAMAKEYNLPTKLLPFIEQHHGTTLIEWFYKRACDTCDPDGPKISDTQFRYAGPKPKSKEIAIVMLADAVESATRAMAEPTSARIESLVHELAMKRLLDGQFDECDLTMRDLERIERTLAKTLQSFYHARIPYPSNRPAPAPVPADQQTATRSA